MDMVVFGLVALVIIVSEKEGVSLSQAIVMIFFKALVLACYPFLKT